MRNKKQTDLSAFCKRLMIEKLAAMTLLLFSLLAHGALAENRGLIWQFEKGGQVSYLLGAIHFANADFYPLSDAMMSAYQQSEVLVVEVDDDTVSIEQQQVILRQYGLYPDNETLRNHLQPETLALIESLLGEFNVPLAHVQRYRPGMIAVTLAALQAEKLGYHADKGIDQYFLQKARHQKKIRQIEDFTFQMKLIAELPEDDAILQESFRDMGDYQAMWRGMMAAWQRGDGDALYQRAIGEALRESPELAPFFNVLFFDRHPRMVKSAEQCISSREICLIVVGAGHLVGDKGIVAELRRRGYRVTQQ